MGGYLKKAFIYIFLLILFIVPVHAAGSHIIVNSADWRDVYSVSLYANLIGVPSNFLVSTRQ